MELQKGSRRKTACRFQRNFSHNAPLPIAIEINLQVSRRKQLFHTKGNTAPREDIQSAMDLMRTIVDDGFPGDIQAAGGTAAKFFVRYAFFWSRWLVESNMSVDSHAGQAAISTTQFFQQRIYLRFLARFRKSRCSGGIISEGSICE